MRLKPSPQHPRLGEEAFLGTASASSLSHSVCPLPRHPQYGSSPAREIQRLDTSCLSSHRLGCFLLNSSRPHLHAAARASSWHLLASSEVPASCASRAGVEMVVGIILPLRGISFMGFYFQGLSVSSSNGRDSCCDPFHVGHFGEQACGSRRKFLSRGGCLRDLHLPPSE